MAYLPNQFLYNKEKEQFTTKGNNTDGSQKENVGQKKSEIKSKDSTYMKFRNRWNQSMLLVERVWEDGYPWG